MFHAKAQKGKERKEEFETNFAFFAPLREKLFTKLPDP